MATAEAENLPENENLPVSQTNSGSMEVVQDDSAGRLQPLLEMQEKFSILPRPKQIQLIMGIAAALALVVMVLIWSMATDTYKLLYGNLDAETSAQIAEILEQENIPYKLDERTGEIMVEPDQLHETRMKLAAQGLPKQGGEGYELLEKEQGFGTSQFMEKARYHRAIEGELARTIANINSVESARVHLAIPKQSVFIRDRREPSASVMVNIIQGRSLGESEIAAIVHMTAASVPDLTTENVTVVDQTGKMLTKQHLPGNMAMSSAQFDYKRKMEEYYIQRIERILMPVVGFEGVRAQVDAEIDFSAIESTQESFNPDLPAVRSEHVIEEERRGGGPGGVPGALTNQPPGVANSPEQVGATNAQQGASSPSSKSRRSTYNYELDRTISHTRQAPGSVKKLSVAVVVDDKLIPGSNGKTLREPLTPEEMDRLTQLVKEAVGFSVQRGDSVNVMNASFMGTKELPPPPKRPFWEEPWFYSLLKQGAGVLVAVMLIMLLIKPVLRELKPKEERATEQFVEDEMEDKVLEAVQAGTSSMGVLSAGISSEEWKKMGLTQEEYQQMLDVLRKTVVEDPRLVAQVVKTWVASDDMEEGGHQ